MINEGDEMNTAGLRELYEETGIKTSLSEDKLTYRNTAAICEPHMLYETLFPTIAKGTPISQHLIVYFY